MFLWFFFLGIAQSCYSMPLAEQWLQNGYSELCDTTHSAATFDALYACFDQLIEFLQTHPEWAQKLYSAKERFIRSKDRPYYATDFFGFYDESQRPERSQISFYYAIHFHAFICAHYPEFRRIPEIMRFFQACLEIQQPYGTLCSHAAAELGIESMFASPYDQPPIILKVIKYLPTYRATRPHYDGTAFSLFIDSTDNQALLLARYTESLTSDDFATPPRTFLRGNSDHSILLIPGMLLTEFSIYPTPHLVVHTGGIRYATVAFAMRPYYVPTIIALSPLPDYND